MVRPPARPRTCHLAVAAATLAVLAAPVVARADGAAEAWGDNANGQLGNGATNPSATPTAVTGFGTGVTAVSANGQFSLAVRNGAVYGWGQNTSGQLGNATSTSSNTPSAAIVLTSGVTAVSAGNAHSMAIVDGALYDWGDNTYGQLGDSTTNSKTIPSTNGAFESGVTAIAAGNRHTVVVKAGVVYTAGDNTYGQLGNGTTTLSSTFLSVPGQTTGVTVVAAGGFHTLAVKNGALYSWGYNNVGQLGNGTMNESTVPLPTSLTSGVTAVAAGASTSLVVQGGHVFAFGAAPLGDGTNNNSAIPVQIDASDLHDIVSVATSNGASFALSSDGSLWVWGSNTSGQLGLGVPSGTYLTPQHLAPPSGKVYSAISAGCESTHALAILSPSNNAPDPFFDGEVPVGNGVYYLAFPINGMVFGYYAYLDEPGYVYHFDLGYEYAINAADGASGIYLYDFSSGDWLYTSPTFPFPYLYDFALGTQLYYYPDPSNPQRYNTNGIRYFYDFASGAVITR